MLDRVHCDAVGAGVSAERRSRGRGPPRSGVSEDDSRRERGLDVRGGVVDGKEPCAEADPLGLDLDHAGRFSCCRGGGRA